MLTVVQRVAASFRVIGTPVVCCLKPNHRTTRTLQTTQIRYLGLGCDGQQPRRGWRGCRQGTDWADDRNLFGRRPQPAQALFGFGRKPRAEEVGEEEYKEEEAAPAKPAFNLKALFGAAAPPAVGTRMPHLVRQDAAFATYVAAPVCC